MCTFNAAAPDDAYTNLGSLSEAHERLEQALRAGPIELTWQDDMHSVTQLSIELVRWNGGMTEGLSGGCLMLTGEFHVTSGDGTIDMVVDGGFDTSSFWLSITLDPTTCEPLARVCQDFGAGFGYAALGVTPDRSSLWARSKGGMSDTESANERIVANGSGLAVPLVRLVDPFGVASGPQVSELPPPVTLERITIRSAGSSGALSANDTCDGSYVDDFSLDARSRTLSWDYCRTSSPRVVVHGSRTLSEHEYQAALNTKSLVTTTSLWRTCDGQSTLTLRLEGAGFVRDYTSATHCRGPELTYPYATNIERLANWLRVLALGNTPPAPYGTLVVHTAVHLGNADASSTCNGEWASYQLNLQTRALDWSSCDLDAGTNHYARRTGARQLQQSEFDKVLTAYGQLELGASKFCTEFSQLEKMDTTLRIAFPTEDDTSALLLSQTRSCETWAYNDHEYFVVDPSQLERVLRELAH